MCQVVGAKPGASALRGEATESTPSGTTKGKARRCFLSQGKRWEVRGQRSHSGCEQGFPQSSFQTNIPGEIWMAFTLFLYLLTS